MHERAGRSGARRACGPKLVPGNFGSSGRALNPDNLAVEASIHVRAIHGAMLSSIALAMFSAMGRAQFGFRCQPLAGS